MGNPEYSHFSREDRDDFYKAIIRNYTMMSDTFMRNVLKDVSCAEYVIQVIMDRKDLRITDLTIQKDYKNLEGHSATLDCVAVDSQGSQFDVEIQQESEGALPQRARYYSGLLDMNTLDPGNDYEKLPETFLILITRRDVLGYELPIYHIDRRIRENGKSFEDRSHIIYVNSAFQNNTDLGRLMHDFHCRDAADMYSPVLAKRVRILKETPEEVEKMCQEMQKIRDMGREEGREEDAIRMLKDNMPYELVAKYTGLSLDRVSLLAGELSS